MNRIDNVILFSVGYYFQMMDLYNTFEVRSIKTPKTETANLTDRLIVSNASGTCIMIAFMSC